MDDFFKMLKTMVETLKAHKLSFISYDISVDDHDYEVTISYKEIN